MTGSVLGTKPSHDRRMLQSSKTLFESFARAKRRDKVVDALNVLAELSLFARENAGLLKLKRSPVTVWPPPEVVLAQDIVLNHEKDIPEEDVKALEFNTAILSLFHTNGVFNDFKGRKTTNHETPANPKERSGAAEAKEAQEAATRETLAKEKEKSGAAEIKKAQDSVSIKPPTEEKEKTAAPDTDLAKAQDTVALETPSQEKGTPDDDANTFMDELTNSEESPTKGKGKSVAQISETPAETAVESKAPHPSRALTKKIPQDDNGKSPTATTVVNDGEIPQVAGAAEQSDMLASSQTTESVYLDVENHKPQPDLLNIWTQMARITSEFSGVSTKFASEMANIASVLTNQLGITLPNINQDSYPQSETDVASVHTFQAPHQRWSPDPELNGGPSHKRSGSQLESPPRKKGRPSSTKKETKEKTNVKWTEVIRDNFEVGDNFDAKTSPYYKDFFEIWEDFCDAPVHKKPPTKQTFDRSLIANFVQFVVDHPKYPQNVKLLPE
ncbi:hypothetical protein M427DRAFT_492797 [Gonapodya prolifera JEL478]|uniref:Uncharacterized protein n=1 Tax=Gonapodya prolifera (strain JEL478) TaxID=1344416 RepID=A0A139ALK8_GONPJ|nr:hypothetical protein M427DRAFT_492797 [Gonapodya prolifera JEL478]|eukprot:KXS17444.1 hypothetical protein M427DRAFT_492797 [Gonapodya prolifera JEL478]